MYDIELVYDIIQQIIDAIETIHDRFKPIKVVNNFTDSPRGKEKLDSICLQIAAIGESLKKIDSITKGVLFSKYPAIDWKGAKAMRDIISHHYFDVDADVIYDVCANKLHPMKEVLHKILDLDLTSKR